SMGGERIVVDAQGSAYVTGTTAAADFPLANPLQRQIGGETDVFVAKLNAAGTALVYSTFLGGSGADSGHGVSVDAQGNVYLTGSTLSPNFPGAMNPPGGNFDGAPDGFVTKLNATGSAIVYSTYLGGARQDAGTDIAVDGAGAAYVAGYTFSENFPTTSSAFQTTLNRGATPNANDAFVTKLSAAGAITYSTYLGGADNEVLFSIEGDIFSSLRMALDSSGAVYVTGATSSSDFPVKNALQPVPGGNFTDAFVAKMDPAKSGTDSLVYATFLGGNELDKAADIAVDAAGAAYILLDQVSLNLPSTPGVFDQFPRVGFLAKLNPSGSALVYATRLGTPLPIPLGTNPDSGLDSEDRDSVFSLAERFVSLAVDAGGNAYLTGFTNSPTFPVTPNAFQGRIAGICPRGFTCLDAFVMKLNANGSALVYSSYLGGGANGEFALDMASDIAVDAMGNAYITGTSGSSDFPTTPGAFQAPTSHVGFITKISADNRSTTVATVSSANFTEPVASESLVSAFGSGLTPLLERLEEEEESPLPRLAPIAVAVRDSAGVERLAPRFFASPSQINYQIPEGTATGEATVSVFHFGSRIAVGAVRIVTVAPGLFTANGNGSGVATALALRLKADGFQEFEPVFRFDPAQGRFVAAPIDLGDANDTVYLVLFGTGFRSRSAPSAVSVQIGSVDSPVLFAGAQGNFLGLDQAVVRLPRSLAGRGEVDLVFVVDAKTANTVRVAFK
ncbi:MAG: SBBP repeat-containing protein, partial [Blastocatellia bacterium]